MEKVSKHPPTQFKLKEIVDGQNGKSIETSAQAIQTKRDSGRTEWKKYRNIRPCNSNEKKWWQIK